MSAKHLGVWLDGVRVATLEAKKPWDVRCRYESEIATGTQANRPLLSCSLPVGRSAAPATPWVRGLLPEGAHLVALALRAKVPTNYYSELLNHYGRDIAGAFTISAGEPEPTRWSVEPYSDDAFVDELRSVVDAPGFGVRDDSELSIAGIQNKLLVTALPNGAWGRPRNGQPSTHIVKLEDERHPGLLAGEHACMQLAYEVGLTSVETTLVRFDDLDALIVERYDRSIDPTTRAIRRIHQEDSCQALGVDIDAARGRGKYERNGGPTFRQIAALIDRYGDPSTDHPRLLRTALFTVAIGNADAHGKNVSFLIDTETGVIRLAPLYDTVPTALWPKLRGELAMTVNGKAASPSIEDFVVEAAAWGVGRIAAERTVDDAVSVVARAAASSPHERVAELVSTNLAALTR